MKDWKDIVIKADCAEPKAIRYYKQSGFRMKACKKFKGSRAMYTKKVKRFKRLYAPMPVRIRSMSFRI